MCFAFVLATIIQFASVHFFTKHGSGEVIEDSEDEDEGDSLGRSNSGSRPNVVSIYFEYTDAHTLCSTNCHQHIVSWGRVHMWVFGVNWKCSHSVITFEVYSRNPTFPTFLHFE